MSARPYASKADAVAVLVDTCKRERQPNANEFRRLLRAFGALGLNPVEMRQACRMMDITRSTGRPWSSDLVSLVPWQMDGGAEEN